jgi:hypothetical protein
VKVFRDSVSVKMSELDDEEHVKALKTIELPES